MTRRLKFIAVVVVMAGALSTRALGHHGTAVSYDSSKNVPITGRVTEFSWRNPHSALFLDVTNEGKVVKWSIELNSPGVLMRSGWTKRTFAPGDMVTIVVHPAWAGTPAGVCLSPCKVTINGKDASLGADAN